VPLSWRPVLPLDASALSRLDRAIKRADGEEMISDRVGDAVSAKHAICASPAGGTIVGVGYVSRTGLGGGVDPRYRRRGLGRRLLAWAEAHAPPDIDLIIRNEALTAGARALYLSRGFEPRMVETRMVRDPAAPLPDAPMLPGVETRTWSESSAPLFFTAYRASFADRPGFTNPPARQWVEELAGEHLQPHLSLVALAASEPVGFITARLTLRRGWIDQIGVAPAWRRRGLGGALLTATLRCFQRNDIAGVFLHVNTNNPRASALFNRLGFRPELQRAIYAKQPRSAPAGDAPAASARTISAAPDNFRNDARHGRVAGRSPGGAAQSTGELASCHTRTSCKN
jgi:mycothiol synthase